MYTTKSENIWNNPYATSQKIKKFYHQPAEEFNRKLFYYKLSYRIEPDAICHQTSPNERRASCQYLLSQLDALDSLVKNAAAQIRAWNGKNRKVLIKIRYNLKAISIFNIKGLFILARLKNLIQKSSGVFLCRKSKS